MTISARRHESESSAGSALMEAVVVAVEDARLRVRALGAPGLLLEESVRVALPGYQPSEGDRVLVQEAMGSGSLYVIGVAHAAKAPSLSAPGGARAELEGERLSLYDPSGARVAVFDGQTGELRIRAEGDLRLSAPKGKVLLEAGESSLELSGDKFAVNASSADFAVGHWELRAERVVERVTDAFRNVDGLLETRAKRLRSIVSTTLEMLSRRTTLISEKDTRIDGERVLLG